MYVRPRARFRPRNAGGAPFSPAMLFTGGTVGAWYDPSDINNYMAGLGPELISNPGPFSATTGWTVRNVDGTLSTGSGVLTLTTTATSWANTPITTVIGQWYKVSGTVTSAVTGGGFYGIRKSDDAPVLVNVVNFFQNPSVPGEFVGYFLATATTSYITLQVNGAGNIAISAISTKQVTTIANATLFQDSAGTTPVTAVEQPVRLMLDKSQGLVLGSELVTGAITWGFSGDTSWTQVSADTVSSTGSTNTNISVNSLLASVGTQYVQVVMTINFGVGSSGLGVRFDSINPNYGPVTSSGTYRFVGPVDTVSLNIFVYSGFIGTITVSVKVLPGNHATAPNDLSRPVLRARYNLLTYSEQFNNIAWLNANSGLVITANDTTAPDGTLTADKLQPNTDSRIYQSPVSSGTNTMSVYAKPNGLSWINIRMRDSGGTDRWAWFNISNGTIGTVDTGLTASISAANNGFYRCVATISAVSGSSAYMIGVVNANNAVSYAPGSDMGSVWVWGADLRTGSSAGTYQRIAAATDYATAGFLPYLAGDGVDDQMSSNSINLTGTDKLTAVFGSFTNSTANQGVFQFGASGAGTINALYMAGATTDMRSSLQGSTGTSQMRITGTGPGVAAVYSELYNIAGATAADESQIRLNGTLPTQTVQSAGPAGGGNFANAALSILQFGSAFFLNGRLYGLIFCGKTLSASELASTEAYVATKTGVTL